LSAAAAPAVDRLLVVARDLQGEGHVVVDRHVRVERVGLEHHGDAALDGRHVVDDHAVDLQRAAGDLLQPRDHPQKRGLAAARGADEDDQLALFDVEVDVAQHGDRAAVGLLDIGQFQIGHVPVSSRLFTSARRPRQVASCAPK
jgi:hypothetical protein